MIWIKRFLPFVVIIAVWIGYSKISESQKQVEEQQVKIYALAAAQIWHTGVALRETPERFPIVRDSLLAASHIDSLTFQQYLQENNEFPEKYREFTLWVNFYSDSLSRDFEASLKSADSTMTIDTLSSQDSLEFEE